MPPSPRSPRAHQHHPIRPHPPPRERRPPPRNPRRSSGLRPPGVRAGRADDGGVQRRREPAGPSRDRAGEPPAGRGPQERGPHLCAAGRTVGTPDHGRHPPGAGRRRHRGNRCARGRKRAVGYGSDECDDRPRRARRAAGEHRESHRGNPLEARRPRVAARRRRRSTDPAPDGTDGRPGHGGGPGDAGPRGGGRGRDPAGRAACRHR